MNVEPVKNYKDDYIKEETLSFVVTLSGTFWEKRPQFSIWLDDRIIIQSELTNQELRDIKFEHTVEQGPHDLKIRLENKADSDTVIENDKIVKDMLLNIDDIIIDDISLGNLLWSAKYIPDKKQFYKGQEVDHLDSCVNLGWNGTYILKFTSPFYIWLLENL